MTVKFPMPEGGETPKIDPNDITQLSTDHAGRTVVTLRGGETLNTIAPWQVVMRLGCERFGDELS